MCLFKSPKIDQPTPPPQPLPTLNPMQMQEDPLAGVMRRKKLGSRRLQVPLRSSKGSGLGIPGGE